MRLSFTGGKELGAALADLEFKIAGRLGQNAGNGMLLGCVVVNESGATTPPETVERNKALALEHPAYDAWRGEQTPIASFANVARLARSTGRVLNHRSIHDDVFEHHDDVSDIIDAGKWRRRSP